MTLPLLKKGDALEYRCFRIFQYMGYFVRKQQGILTCGGLNQVTDLDLYGIKFHSDFSRDLVIAECKSQKKLGPLDRILWIKGVKEIAGARSAFLIIPRAQWDIKDYAFGKGIKIIDFESLDRIESAFNINKDSFYGLTDATFYEPLYDSWKHLLSTGCRYGKLLEFLTVESKTISPNKGINRLFSEIKWILPKLNISKNSESQVSLWLLYECVIYMAIYILQICEYLQNLNEIEGKGYLEKMLTYGDWNSTVADNLLKDSWACAKKLSKEQLGKSIIVPEAFCKFPAPPYFKGIAEVAERFCKNPNSSKNVHRLLDIMFFEFLFKNKPIEQYILDLLLNLGSNKDMTIKQAKNIIELFIKYASVPVEYFKPILDL